MKKIVKKNLFKSYSTYFLLLTMIFSSTNLYSQELAIYVKKGSVVISDKTIYTGSISKIKSTDVIEVNKLSLVILKKANQIVELKSEKKYNYNNLIGLFSKKKSFSKVFSDVVFSPQMKSKSSAGITTRGTSEDPFNYFPDDSLSVLGDSINIIAGFNQSKLLSNIRLYGTGINDTIVLSKEFLKHKIQTPSAGTYYWEYEITHKSVTAKAKNVFIVPDKTKKLQLLQDLNEFINQLKGFSKEMQDLLLEEYYILNKIFF